MPHKFSQPKPKMNAVKLARTLYLDMCRQHLVPGDQLDTERNLASHYEVARGTVRAALAILIKRGVLSHQHGRGTFLEQVLTQPRSEFANLTSPVQLMEVREAIEPVLVKMAVKHATMQDLEKLQAASEKLFEQTEAVGFSAADERFHFAIAEACGNPLMIWVYQQINDIRHHDMWRRSRRLILDEQNIAFYNQQHSQLIDAIFNRDVQKAGEVMSQHLDKARDDLLFESKSH